jgi:hypothetical protein
MIVSSNIRDIFSGGQNENLTRLHLVKSLERLMGWVNKKEDLVERSSGRKGDEQGRSWNLARFLINFEA